MSNKLKPCPFCGGDAEITKWHEGYFVECKEQRCGGTIGAYKTEEKAIEAWNTRVEKTCEGCVHEDSPDPYPCCCCSRDDREDRFESKVVE